MSKELPYFKFYVNEWITGDITLEDLEIQGLFINLCAYYWSKECRLNIETAKKKFRNADDTFFETLIKSKIIKIDTKGDIKINYLLDQKYEWEEMAVRNKKNGQKGGRPKPTNNPLYNPSVISGLATNNPNITNIEDRIEEEIRKEEKIVDVVSTTSSNFLSISECRKNYEAHFVESITIIKKESKLSDNNFKLILDQFDTHLVSEGRLKKEPSDYAKHFSSWLKKFDYKGLINSKVKTQQSDISKYEN